MTTEKKPWRKVLYEHQPYPDNYTEEAVFLRDLRTNINTQPHKIGAAILGATLLLQEFCTVVAFGLIFVYLYNEWAEPEFVLQLSCVVTGAGFILYRLVYSGNMVGKFGTDLRTLLIFMVFGHLFSPVLHTLTDTISTDTIYNATFLMMLVHLVFFDYGVSAAIVSNSLSLSAAIFGSICLASRLASAQQAFILITAAIELFVLFPLLRRRVQKSVVITALLFLSDCYFLMRCSPLFLGFFLITALFINILCPALFVRYQRYKLNIHGPWDEAIVDDAVIS